MNTKSSLKEQCQRILEENGGKIADRASRILLDDPMLKDLRSPLEFISRNWRDPLTPSLMSLSCEAVGGLSEVTHEAAMAMSLINLSFYIWDDIIDKVPFKLFKPTFVGKFGEGTALMIGGLASAKAFSILNQMNVDKTVSLTITRMLWNLCTKMAKAERINLKQRTRRSYSSRKKFLVIKMEAADLETCLRIGAILGNGSKSEAKQLGMCGLYLGIILEIWKDFHVSVNLTLELAEKIRNGALPYSFLWAMEHSERIRKKIRNLVAKNTIESSDIREIVKDTLETKALDNGLKIIRKFAKKAEGDLFGLKRNRATQTLKFFVEAQPQLFVESLYAL